MKKNNRIIISFFVFVLILATVLGKGVPVFAEENEVPVITEENADTKIVATISTPNGEKEFFSGEPFSVSLGIISGKSAVSYNKAELVFEFPDPEGMNMINSWPPADTMKLKSLSYTGEGKDRTRTATYVIENLFGGYTGELTFPARFPTFNSPSGYTAPLKMYVKDKDGNILASNEITVKAKNNNPIINKSVLTLGASSTIDGVSVFGGTSADKKQIDADGTTYVTFSYKIRYDIENTNGATGVQGMIYYDKVEITDTLPEGAEFDSEANEGWTLSPDGKSVSFMKNDLNNIDNPVYYHYDANTNSKTDVAQLKLRFPGAPLNTNITNTMDFKFTNTLLEKYGYTEKDGAIYTHTDSLVFKLYSDIPSANIQKGSPTNKKGILINSFHETPYFHADEYSWPITVRNQSEMNLNNLVIENKE